MPSVRLKRADLKPGEVLCSYCTALCCRYFTMPVTTPKNWEDFDTLRWYMMHGRTSLFVEDESWYLIVFGDCENLLSDNRCGIYHDRPAVCSAYSTEVCEYDNDFVFEKYFETADQIWEYAEAILPPRPRSANGSAAKGELSLPILQQNGKQN
jgi:uncharacterized protein